MKRLLSLLLVIAMLFGICTVFTACDSASDSSQDEDDDDDKKKDDKDDEDDDVEPTLVLKGLKIVLPEDFKVDSKNVYDDENTGNAMLIGKNYTVHIACGPMEDEIEGMSAKEFRDYIVDQMDPEDEDSEIGEYDSGTKKKTPYFYAVKDDETTAVALSFYVDDNYAWQVRILPNEDSEDFNVEEMIDLICGWKCSAPKPGDKENEDDDDKQNETRPPEDEKPSGTPSGDDSVIYDNMGITVTVTGVETTYSYYVFNLEVENNSGTSIKLSAEDCVINGISTVYCSFYGEAKDGETAQCDLLLDLDRLDDLDIEAIGDVEFSLIIYDSSYEYLEDGARVSILTDDAGYQHTVDDSGDEIFNKSGIRIVVQDIEIEDEYEARMYLYVENNTSEPLSINLENVVINGWLLPSTSGYCTVMPGTNTIENVDISDVWNLGITDEDDIQNMLFSIGSYNSDTYESYYEEENLAYYPGDKNFELEIDIEGIVLYDANDIFVLLLNVEEDSDYARFHVYIRNNTNQTLNISLEDTTINGVEVYDSMYSTMPAGSQALDWLTIWYTDDADFNSMNDLESLVVTLYALNSNYMTVVKDTVTMYEN